MIKVVCAVVIIEDKILICQRSLKMSLPLKWEFPGGKLEINESEEEAVIRELNEELSITVLPYKRLNKIIHHYPTVSVELIPIVCRFISGEIILKEHIDYKWCSKEDLYLYDFADADKPIIEEIILLWNSEFMKL